MATTTITMPSAPASPVTPSRRNQYRRLSNIHRSSGSATSDTSTATTSSRRSSRTFQTSCLQHSPTTPRARSSRSSNQEFYHKTRSGRRSMSSDISQREIDTNGLGSLADELGEVWEQDDIEDPGSSFLDGLREGTGEPEVIQYLHSPAGLNDMHDLGYGATMPSPSIHQSASLQAIVSSEPASGDANGLMNSNNQGYEPQYERLDYGLKLDREDLLGCSPWHGQQICEGEEAVRPSVKIENILSEDGGVIERATSLLKDLWSQSSIENSLTRLLTTYTSMAMHRTHKTRELFSQAHWLLYSSFLTLPEEVIDLLLSDIEELASTITVTQRQNPLLSLRILSSHTNDLVQSLRSLTDVLTESRTVSNAASRKLKSVKDMVEEMRIEEELRKESMKLIQVGDWDRRCEARHAARICKEVIAGFSETCDQEREKWVGAIQVRDSYPRERSLELVGVV